MPEPLFNRRADNWRTQIQVADLAGDDWGDRARAAAVRIEGQSDSRTVGVKLLTDIKAIFDADATAQLMSSADIIAGLIADTEGPWQEFARGKPLTQNRLAKMLSAYGITSQTVRLSQDRTARGYKRQQFDEVWASYVV